MLISEPALEEAAADAAAVLDGRVHVWVGRIKKKRGIDGLARLEEKSEDRVGMHADAEKAAGLKRVMEMERSRDRVTRVTDGSLQGGDATDDGGGNEVGVVVVVLEVDVDVVVGLGRRGQMSRWIWHRPENGGRRREKVRGPSGGD